MERKGLAGWWQGIRGKAEQVVVDQQVAFVRGKIAGVAVTDDTGKLLVDSGQRIDGEIISRAQQAGKMGALAAAAAKGQQQDLKEAIHSQYARTDTAKEAQLLDSVEEYAEARRYINRILTMDVTDIRGNVIVPTGKKIDDEDIRRARDAGQIAAFLAAAEQALPAPSGPVGPAPTPYGMPAPVRPVPRLLAEPDEE